MLRRWSSIMRLIITVTIGVGALQERETLGKVLDHRDRCLYKAKNEERNHVNHDTDN